jgi:hypothetical protein
VIAELLDVAALLLLVGLQRRRRRCELVHTRRGLPN